MQAPLGRGLDEVERRRLVVRLAAIAAGGSSGSALFGLLHRLIRGAGLPGECTHAADNHERKNCNDDVAHSSVSLPLLRYWILKFLVALAGIGKKLACHTVIGGAAIAPSNEPATQAAI